MILKVVSNILQLFFREKTEKCGSQRMVEMTLRTIPKRVLENFFFRLEKKITKYDNHKTEDTNNIYSMNYSHNNILM